MSPAPFWMSLTWALAGLAAAAGLMLALSALLPRRSDLRRRCPGCSYDLASAPAPTPAQPITCPECGRRLEHETDLRRARRRWGLALVGLLLTLPLVSFLSWRFGPRLLYTVLPEWRVTSERIVGQTTIRTLVRRDPGSPEPRDRVVILHAGAPILDVQDYAVTLGQTTFDPSTGAGGRLRGAIDDLNGDGVPELLVFAFSGGAHCCYTVHLFELSSPPRLIAAIDAQNGLGLVEIPPPDPRAGQVCINLPDQSFDYWNAPHAASPMPSVLFRLRDHQLQVDLDRMLAPPPPADQLAATAAAVRQAMAPPGAPLDPALWATMLSLIYSGQETFAWTFADQAWPPERPGKDAFLAEFRQLLARSLVFQAFTAAQSAHVSGASPPPARLPAPSAQGAPDPTR